MECNSCIQLLPNRIITSGTILPHVWKGNCSEAYTIVHRKLKYLGSEEGIFDVELIKELFHVVAFNLEKARRGRDGSKPR